MCVKEPVLRVKLLHVKSIRRKLVFTDGQKSNSSREREKNTSQRARNSIYPREYINRRIYVTDGPRTEQSGESQALRVRKKSSPKKASPFNEKN